MEKSDFALQNRTSNLAEREGFEPPVLLQTTVFKTAAFDHSAISPGAKVVFAGVNPNPNQKKSASLLRDAFFLVQMAVIQQLFF